MGSHDKKKKIKVKTFQRKDLYHDVKPEKKEKLNKKEFEKQLLRQEIELVKLQEWVKANKLKVVVIFERTVIVVIEIEINRDFALPGFIIHHFE